MTRTQHHARRWLLPAAIWAACTGPTALAQDGLAAAEHPAAVPHNEQGHAVNPSGPAITAPGHQLPATQCYPNCDGSSAAPALNVLDFSCFLNAFAAADPYANCDGSATPPVLNVLDFACFLNQFAAGCP